MIVDPLKIPAFGTLKRLRSPKGSLPVREGSRIAGIAAAIMETPVVCRRNWCRNEVWLSGKKSGEAPAVISTIVRKGIWEKQNHRKSHLQRNDNGTSIRRRLENAKRGLGRIYLYSRPSLFVQCGMHADHAFGKSTGIPGPHSAQPMRRLQAVRKAGWAGWPLPTVCLRHGPVSFSNEHQLPGETFPEPSCSSAICRSYCSLRSR
ncbi:hypothetical protein SAMN05421753_10413 [Planctomicrobium piriforme]|uniref:Uncharacterized protein n=1 Tax=Planctomicrobium piriforme TaxID=1576369 RepID=A0A1I3DZA7_9PLAN|nr:hypothetical protein SAMN05421753_10413 [Planctomicrobium piriforme]